MRETMGFLLAFLLVGCGNSSPTEPVVTSYLDGTVDYGASFKPLVGATVTLQGKTTTTSGAGTFSFTGLTPGVATLSMTAKAGEITPFADTFTILAGKNVAYYHRAAAATATPCVGCQ